MSGTEYKFISYSRPNIEKEEALKRSGEYYEFMNLRRSVRDFSNAAVPKLLVENIIKTASTAPSGAHKQPWTFVAISDPVLKKKILPVGYPAEDAKVPDLARRPLEEVSVFLEA